MIDRIRRDFEARYHGRPVGPGFIPNDQLVPRKCVDCKVDFMGTRAAKRCATCRLEAKKQSHDRSQKNRRAARGGR